MLRLKDRFIHYFRDIEVGNMEKNSEQTLLTAKPQGSKGYENTYPRIYKETSQITTSNHLKIEKRITLDEPPKMPRTNRIKHGKS